jgi:hypothetical protein
MSFQLRQFYNFDLWPVTILGSGHKNVSVLAIMDAEMANKEIDIKALHVNVFPFLPAGSPNSEKGYDYIKIKTQSGETRILGMAWIKADTIELVQSKTATIVINVIDSDTVRLASDALIKNGITPLSVSVT